LPRDRGSCPETVNQLPGPLPRLNCLRTHAVANELPENKERPSGEGSDLKFRLERTTGFEPATLTLAKKPWNGSADTARLR
jgi:hypothetical protein